MQGETILKYMFAGFLEYTEEEYRQLWQEAIFVVDTNILLNFYKYTSKESTRSFFDILKKLKDVNRLWIPYQVALEYFHNVENNMNKQREGYNSLGTELKGLKKEAEKIFSKVKSSYPYILTDNFQFFIENMQKSNEQLQNQLNKEIETLPNTDSIKSDIYHLITGIVGEPFDQEKIDKIEVDGKERYEHGIPPGYKDREDKQKQGYRHYGGIQYQQLFGDLIVWNQIIDKAVELERPVIFITEEKKEDWWEKQGTQIKRPQPNLIQEFFNKTGKKFYMYRTENFVKFAKEYIGADLTDEQVKEVTKEVENIRKFEDAEEKEQRNELLHNEALENNSMVIGRIDDLKRIKVEDLLDYLTSNQSEMLLEKIRNSFDINLTPEASSIKYTHAIAWALTRAIPRLEEKLQDLISEFAIKDLNKAQTILGDMRILGLINDPVEKGIFLLGKIKDLETLILLDGLPF